MGSKDKNVHSVQENRSPPFSTCPRYQIPKPHLDMGKAEKHKTVAVSAGARSDDGFSEAHEVKAGTVSDMTIGQSLTRCWLAVAWTGVILGTFAIYLDGVSVSTFQPYALSEFSHLSIEGGMLTVSSLVAISKKSPVATDRCRSHG
ncbi:hypothetical protein ACHAPT_009864 [Fusarium lateritium]